MTDGSGAAKSGQPVRRRRSAGAEVAPEEGQRALIVAARLVDLHGKVYLPIFERLERELVALHRRELAIERAKKIAATRGVSAYREAALSDPFSIYATVDRSANASR